MRSERRLIWIGLIFAVLLTMLAFLSGGCAADTYAVCPGGSCNYSSIQAAVNATSGGDTIIAHDGTYAENDKYLIAIGFILTILIFIASCFYAVRTSALNNMYTSEVNCYTYIKYADNTPGKEKYMYQDIAKKWYKDSNRAIDLHQKNCAFVVGSLYSFFLIFIIYLSAIFNYFRSDYAFMVTLITLFVLIVFIFAILKQRLSVETVNRFNLLPKHSPFTNCSISHEIWFEKELKSHLYLDC